MNIEGRLLDNLQASLASARRLNGHPVYRDTLVYWQDLLKLARGERLSHDLSEQAQIDSLIAKLQQELAERGAL